jgi:hypothetical protein
VFCYQEDIFYRRRNCKSLITILKGLKRDFRIREYPFMGQVYSADFYNYPPPLMEQISEHYTNLYIGEKSYLIIPIQMYSSSEFRSQRKIVCRRINKISKICGPPSIISQNEYPQICPQTETDSTVKIVG